MRAPRAAARFSAFGAAQRAKLQALLPRWAQASMLVMALSVSGKLFGMLRELEMARLFGVGSEVDAFLAALTLVLFMARMGSDSLLISTPGLVRKLESQRTPAQWVDLLRAVLLVGAVLTLLAWVILPALVPVLFSGLPPADQALARRLIRTMLPMVSGWTIIGAAAGVLNSQERYGRHQIALMVANVGVLAVLWLLAKHIGIEALAWGWAIGIWMGAAVIAGPLFRKGWQVGFWRGWASQWLTLRSLVVGAAGLSLWFMLNQIPVWIERHYAVQLPSGSLAALGYAQRLFQLPLEMVTAVITNVWVARVAAMPGDRVARQTFRVLGPLAGVTLPAALLLALLARPVVTLVYARGAFDAAAVSLTTGPFAMYALGLGFQALSMVLVRTFQARGLVRYPMLAVTVDIVLTGLLNAYALQRGWGVTAIAAIYSCVAAVRVIILATCVGLTGALSKPVEGAA